MPLTGAAPNGLHAGYTMPLHVRGGCKNSSFRSERAVFLRPFCQLLATA